MSEPVTVETRLAELRRTRWILWGLGIACCLVGFGAGPLLWGLGLVCIILAVKTEWLIHRGERLRDAG
jgi:hypothetical protein